MECSLVLLDYCFLKWSWVPLVEMLLQCPTSSIQFPFLPSQKHLQWRWMMKFRNLANSGIDEKRSHSWKARSFKGWAQMCWQGRSLHNRLSCHVWWKVSATNFYVRNQSHVIQAQTVRALGDSHVWQQIFFNGTQDLFWLCLITLQVNFLSGLYNVF